MLSEQYEALNKRIDDLRDYMGVQFGDIKSQLNVQCEKCAQVSSLREKIRTLFTNVYAIWFVMFTFTCAVSGGCWWMFVTYVLRKG